MTVCKFYKNGLCISPKLDKPTDVVTSTTRCFGNPTTCQYYIEEEKKTGLAAFNSKEGISYLRINIIDDTKLLERIENTDCSYFRYNKIEQGAIAYCTIMNRMLTEGQAKNCILHGKKCPIRKSI